MKYPKDKEPIKFIIIFIVLFLAFYYANIVFFGLTLPGNHYNAFLAEYLNYIAALRWLLIKCTLVIIKFFGYTAINNTDKLLVAGRSAIIISYSCLGLGVLSFFSAFVIAYPKPIIPKLVFLFAGIIVIEFLNVIRFVLLALYWDKHATWIDHHTIFNIIIYIVIVISLYNWMRANYPKKPYAAN